MFCRPACGAARQRGGQAASNVRPISGPAFSKSAAEAERFDGVFRTDWARQPQLVEDVLGKEMLALLIQMEAACTAADNLAEAVEVAFPQYPDAGIGGGSPMPAA